MELNLTRKLNIILTSCLLVVALAVTLITGITYKKFKNSDIYFDTSKCTSVQKFSDYSPSLKGTIGDSNIYVIDSGVEGPSIMIIGGTHPNEPAGQLAATLLLENLTVTKGKVFIITECNRSAYGYSYPLEASPMYYQIETQNGTRTFMFGTRATNTTEQWPNPDVYVHNPSGQKLSAGETRNLNRCYPGKIDGTYTERVAYAVTECIRQNQIQITIDLHEASPEYVTINAMIYHERAANLVARAQMYMDDDHDVKISVEPSSKNLHGLTHRELGDHTAVYDDEGNMIFPGTLALICETSNASQGKIRGAFTTDIIVDGTKDKYYSLINEKDQERDPSDKILYAAPVSIDERVARHVLSVMSIIQAYNKTYKEYNEALGKFGIDDVPDYEDILSKGLGYYLSDPV